jgi:hypothetical protein
VPAAIHEFDFAVHNAAVANVARCAVAMLGKTELGYDGDELAVGAL